MVRVGRRPPGLHGLAVELGDPAAAHHRLGRLGALALALKVAAHRLGLRARGAQATPRLGRLGLELGDALVGGSGGLLVAAGQRGGPLLVAASHTDGGLVKVASSASRYNPVYYWTVGTPASLADGAGALYVMRIVSALLCAALIAVGAWALSLWARTRWPWVALILTMTPVVIFSTTVVASNGVEMAAALSVWCALLGLAATTPPTAMSKLVWACLPGALVLVTVRSLGPLWLALMVGTVIIVAGRAKLLEVLRQARRAVISVVVLVSAATLAGVGWSILNGTNAPEGDLGLPDPVGHTLAQVPLWAFQSVAAFPTRSNESPTFVYAAALAVFITLLAAGLTVASTRVRIGMIVAVVASLGIPALITVQTYSASGSVWQGRYTLPYAFGVALLAGLALEQRDFHPRLLSPIVLLCGAGFGAAQLVAVVELLDREKSRAVSHLDPNWIEPSGIVVALIVLAAMGCWAMAAVQALGPGTGSRAATADGVHHVPEGDMAGGRT